MARILLQTTIPYVEDDWHVGRFSLLAHELEAAGHTVTARNREPGSDGDDPILSTLARDRFDQLWLLAVDCGNGPSERDLAGIAVFREAGGGVLTARDHQDLGECICELGSLGAVNYFHTRHPEADESRLIPDDRDNPDIGWPNYHSGANGDYQRIEPLEPAHEVLRLRAGGVITDFPAHPHEGAVGAPASMPFARVIARGTSLHTGRTFPIAVALDGEPRDEGEGSKGRALAESTFHHFADVNWDASIAPPSFVTDKPGDGIAREPEKLELFKEYVGNIARWLSE